MSFPLARPYNGQLLKQAAQGDGSGSPGGAAPSKLDRKRELHRKRQARYAMTAKGRATQIRYNRTQAGRMMRNIWNLGKPRRLQKTLHQQIRRQNGR